MSPVEIEEAISALAERPFDPQEFPYAFLEAFGNKETTLRRLCNGESNMSDFKGHRGSALQTNNIFITRHVYDPTTAKLVLASALEYPL